MSGPEDMCWEIIEMEKMSRAGEDLSEEVVRQLDTDGQQRLGSRGEGEKTPGRGGSTS